MLVGVLSASASLGRFTECIEAGFRIHEVSSTSEHVVVELEKEDQRVTVKMGPEAARSLLGLERIRKARRMAAGRTS